MGRLLGVPTVDVNWLVAEVPTHGNPIEGSILPMPDPQSEKSVYLPLSQKLRALRKGRSLTQADVAAAVGVGRSTLAGLESGADLPGRETMRALATFFEVDLDWLADNGSELKSDGAAKAQNEDEALLLYAYRNMPEDESKPLLKLLLNRVRRREN